MCKLNLTEILESLSKSLTAPHREVIRAKALLLAAEGITNTAIAARLGISPGSVAAWRKRFAEEGLAKIGRVRARRGRKPKIPADKIDEIVKLTQSSKPPGETHWSCRSMASASGVSSATVQRVWSSRGLKPHLVKTFKLSNDKRFEEKLMRRIDKEVAKSLQVHIIRDNYGTHRHPNVTAWVAKHPRFHLHFTPTSSSWLNLVERWFRELTDKAIRRGVFGSGPDQVAAIEAYLAANNETLKPFEWTATAEQILEKVRRGRVPLEAIAT